MFSWEKITSLIKNWRTPATLLLTALLVSTFSSIGTPEIWNPIYFFLLGWTFVVRLFFTKKPESSVPDSRRERRRSQVYDKKLEEKSSKDKKKKGAK